MQIIKSLAKLIVFILPVSAFGQTTYLSQGAKENRILDRLEIKLQRNADLNFSTLKPYSRRSIALQTLKTDSALKGNLDTLQFLKKKDWAKVRLTSVDQYNMRSLLMNNSEWVEPAPDYFQSSKPVLKTFYKKKPNLLEVNTKDFYLALNPVLQFRYGNESDYDESLFLNSRGVTLRGMIAKRIGFSSTLIENQERGPLFYQDRVGFFEAVPGVGFYKKFKTSGYDYFDARGYITFNAAKYLDFQFGYDKNTIGNGYRSLFLSDWGNSYLFAKINTRIWKINYQNIFMELIPQFRKRSDSLLSRKYAAMHHLSMNVTRWLNVGVFEGIIFGRDDHYDFQYLNPIIFYRHIEGSIGSPDNAVAGIDFKANVAHRFQFYGQFLMDEFILSRVKNDPTNWVNKFAIQVGAKYVDAFGVKNLDLQVEMNRVRPFTYSHSDTISNYTHYNQPLAHPLGANFQEFIGIVHYQPTPRWTINARVMYYYQGLDSAGLNFGSNPFRDYKTRFKETGYEVGSGREVNVFNGTLDIAYELRENLFFEAFLQQRNYKVVTGPGTRNSTMISAGIRLNMFRKAYDF